MRRLLMLLFAGALLSIGIGSRADLIKQSASYHRMVLMTQAADHITGATGLTLTIMESKAGGAFGAATPTVTERGSGWYDLLLTSADDATLGSLAMHITGAAADPTDTLDQVVAFDPASATNLGLSALPTANPAASGGFITIGIGAGQLNPNGTGGLASITTVASGTAQAGGASTIALAAGSSATTDLYKGSYLLITGGTGAGQARTITAYNGGTLAATVSRPWTVNPDATSVYAVIANPHPALDSNLAVLLQPVQTGVTIPMVTALTNSVTVGGYATGQDPATLLQAMAVDGTLTFKQLKAIEAAVALDGDRTFSATTHIAVLTYYRRASGGTGPDKTKPILTKTTTYDSSNTQVVSQTITLSNLP